MSLERIYKRAVRDVKRRDAELANKGTTAGIEASRAPLSPQMAPEGKVRNDSGYGFKEDSEGIKCRTCGTKYTGSLTEHTAKHK